LVTHGNLSAGYQTAQIAHVIAEFVLHNPRIAEKWHGLSNSLIVLEAKDARALSELQEKALSRGIHVHEFREPDLGDEITALAFEPHPGSKKLLSNLPLAGTHFSNQQNLRHREREIRKLSYAMMDCEQTKGQNVLQHGRSVREHYFALVDHLSGRVDLSETSNWKLPAWIDAYSEQILASLPARYVMDRYLTLHDCGKPAVRQEDADGKVHFPDHAESSTKVYREVFGENADSDVEYLIAHDMDVHMMKAADIPEFAKSPTAVGQLLAALAEVTSNASMFGGVESTSFKIKYKQIDQRGKALLKALSI
jgi:hypothetical protein